MKSKSRVLNKYGQSGYAHMLFVGIGVLVLIVAIGTTVYAEVHKSGHQSVDLSESKSKSVSSNAAIAKPKTATTTGLTPASSSSTTTATTKSSTSSTKPTSTASSTPSTSTTSSSSSSNSNTGSSSTSETPLSALTDLIANIDNGGSEGYVTAEAITIPGPISNATGQPLVFSVNGQTYFAYTQEQKPNFSQSASATANSMAIVNASGSYTLVSAYLDKSGELTDASFQLVGYSTGGN